jgi:hypothetical protein
MENIEIILDNPIQIIITLLVFILSLLFLVELYMRFRKLLPFKTKREHMQEEHEAMLLQHNEDLKYIKSSLELLAAANREALADRINQKYKIYFRLGYIPEDEYEEFVHLHDAYKGVGGNHTGDLKFDKCIKRLPIKADPIDSENK